MPFQSCANNLVYRCNLDPPTIDSGGYPRLGSGPGLCSRNCLVVTSILGGKASKEWLVGKIWGWTRILEICL